MTQTTDTAFTTTATLVAARPAEVIIEKPRPVRSVNRNDGRRLRFVLAAIVALLAVYPAWMSRFDLINDTVSYLDMGDLFFSGQFGFIVNGTWGPLYALLLGSWLHILRPQPQWEYPAIHALLFLVFVFTIACFDAFLAALLQFRERNSADHERDDGSGPGLTIIGYVIFAWCALVLVGIQETNPDMLVAALFFLACACTLRVYTQQAGWRTALVLGLAVAGAFLTKPASLPASAALICIAALPGRDLRARAQIGLTAACVAGILSLPYVAALSLQEGHLTFSESGTYNYAVHVDGVPDRNWQGDTATTGQAAHPTRQLLSSPGVFEFATPLPGTYPYWFDPSYWYAGVKAPVVWAQQKAALLNNAHAFYFLAFAINCAALAVFVLLQSFGIRRPRALRQVAAYWIIAVPAVITLIPYLLIHWEPRYLAGGICVLFITAIASARLPALPQTRQIYTAAACMIAVLFFIPGGPSSEASKLDFWQAVRLHWPQSQNVYWDTAAALHEAGYPEGTKVATIEFGDMSHMIWARLARVQIIAEIDYRPDAQHDHYPRERTDSVSTFFWDDPADQRDQALDALKSAGASVLVTAETPHGPDAAHWHQLADSGYYYRPL